MPKEIHFYDTTNAIINYDKDRIDSNPYHFFNITIPLRSPLVNLKSISLKNVEMPIKLTTVRQSNLTTSFKIKFSYNTFINTFITISLSPQFYSITTLIQEINTKVTAVTTSFSGLSIVFSTQIGSQNSGSICVITHNCSALEIEDTPFTNYILGYVAINSAGSLAGILMGQSAINLNAIDTCVYLKFLNLPVMNNNNPNGYTFKVPVNNISNGTVFFNDTTEHQKIYFNNTNFVLNKLDVIVVDRLGFNLYGFNHWTFSLIIDYAEKNNSQHNI